MSAAAQPPGDNDEPARPVVRNPLPRIWLNVGDIDEDCEFGSLSDVTWSDDDIDYADIEYVLATELAAAQATIADLEKSWRCFHCDETFTDYGHARNHFGYTPEDGAPSCRTTRGEDSELYHLKKRLELYQQEDTDLHRQIHALEAEHVTALRREEEAGYARGLKDYTTLEAERDQLRATIARQEQALEQLRDSACDKIMAMTDEQIAALSRLEGHDPADEAKLGKQAIKIAMQEVEIANLASVVRRQAEEMERQRKDAERYRWLRANHQTPTGGAADLIYLQHKHGNELDAAIDAALAKEPK